MKGLILAGGKGTRLLPATRVTNKHMVPILNTPMIVYPLNTLKSFGITDIMVVSGGEHIGQIAEFLGDGSEFGVNITYRVQKEAGGIAQALGIARDFMKGEERFAVILGDNIFDNSSFSSFYYVSEATIFYTKVSNPERFGVPVFKKIPYEGDGNIERIEEKPKNPLSNYAVTGLYIYPENVFDFIATLEPSARGELEITDVNNYYIKKGKMSSVEIKGFWSDAGTPKSLKEVTDWAYKKLTLDK